MKEINGGILAAEGFLGSAVKTGVKNSSLDLAIIYCENQPVTAAVFTTNKVQAAPVVFSKNQLKAEPIKAIVVNSGIANACTGEQGRLDTIEMAEVAADNLEIDRSQVLIASTGIIGKNLPMTKIRPGIVKAANSLTKVDNLKIAESILTTDSNIKEKAFQFEIAGTEINLGGVAKGSGMIEPNMATMLAFFTTDLAINKKLLQEAFKKVTDQSFNKITVDGDQSTNDMAAIMASGRAGNPEINSKNQDYKKFVRVLKEIATYLAQSIVKDGEGSTKFVEITASGVRDDKEAELIARKIANSPLVKTAIYGEAPSWGRIAAAVGSVSHNFYKDDLIIEINDINVFGPSEKVYNFPRSILKEDEITIKVKLNAGSGSATIWTCDFSHGYIDVNTKYYN
ncbi:MAG: bifunctional glutamate N-acetyltransferase/amino-acid acetyltransferase ArgJ [Halanaerobiaceae bacterium]